MRELSPQSTEYQDVLYRLQLCYNSTDVVSDIKVWDISNPHAAVAFDRISSKKLIVDCFVDADTCSDDTGVFAVEGLKCPSDGSGITFNHGEVPAKVNEEGIPKEQRSLILASVAVGRASIHSIEETYGGKKVVPNGYDCVLMKTGTTCFDEENEEGETVVPYKAKFQVFDQQQIMPKYLVKYKYHDHDCSSGKTKRKCDICEKNVADVYCKADDAFLCAGCDIEVHSANKLVSKHIRVPVETLKSRRRMSGLRREVGGNLDVFKSRCPCHPSQHVEFFCPTCDIPVCIHCKMVGSHSSGEPGTHTLVGLDSAWKAAVERSEQPDVALEACAQSIEHHLSDIESKREAVKSNSSDVQRLIREMAEEALDKVRSAESEKLAVLHAAELEMKRKIDEIEWSESFLQKQKDSLLPVDFLMAWTRHQRLRKQLRDVRIDAPPALHEVVPDIVADVRTVNVDTTSPHLEGTGSDSVQDDQNIFATLTNRFNTFGRRNSRTLAAAIAKSSNPTTLPDSRNVGSFNMADMWRQSLREKVSGAASCASAQDADKPETQGAADIKICECTGCEHDCDASEDFLESEADDNENEDPLGFETVPVKRSSRLSVGGEEAIM